MTAPAYGYTHIGSVVRPDDEVDGYWHVRCGAINPARPIGPYASTVHDLAVDDRVLLTQIGTTRDLFVITGKLPPDPWEAHLPIGIDDVTGLQAALDDRATDAELAALETTTSLNFSAVNDRDDAQDGRLSVLETARSALEAADAALQAADAALDGRLDVLEPAVAANTSGLATANADITALTNYAWFNQAHEADSYGDLVSSFPRTYIANLRTLTSNGLLAFRTRARRAFSPSLLRVLVVAAGVGAGTTTGALYKCATQSGVFALASQGTNALATTGIAAFTLGATPVAAGEWLLLVVRASGYTTFPQLGTVQNAVRGGATNPSTAQAAFPTRTTAGALPATMDTTDGSWGIVDATPTWMALA